MPVINTCSVSSCFHKEVYFWIIRCAGKSDSVYHYCLRIVKRYCNQSNLSLQKEITASISGSHDSLSKGERVSFI